MEHEAYQDVQWPVQPRWKVGYPSEGLLRTLVSVIEKNTVRTVFYKGLAEPKIVETLSCRRPGIEISVWDHFGYWPIDRMQWGEEERDASELPAWLHGVPFHVGEGGGGRWNYSDLVILDANTNPSSSAFPMAKARVVLLAGEVRKLGNMDEYSWEQGDGVLVGTRKPEIADTRCGGLVGLPDSAATPEWDDVFPAIFDLYAVNEVEASEMLYLEQAFRITEKLWHAYFDRVRNVKWVMLSEAPQFGATQTYFYNLEAPFTSFFWPDDARPIIGDALFEGAGKFDGARTDQLFEKLADAGFVVLDVFPFALNKNDTDRTYPNLRRAAYSDLYRKTADAYFRKKLNLVFGKCDRLPVFLSRYARLKERIDGLIEKDIIRAAQQYGFSTEELVIESIHGGAHSLDRQKLSAVVKRRKPPR